MKHKEPYGEINTFLSEGTFFEGVLSFEGTIRIDGKIEGEIKSSDTLIVGETAEIRGTINVGNIVIYGHVYGELFVKNKIEMKEKARVFGNLHTSLIDINNGALFEGNCEMLKKKKSENEGEQKQVATKPETSETGAENVIAFDVSKKQKPAVGGGKGKL